ncbi:MAG: hypothetical protein EBR82_57350, partial [Caulobacteraceae bacterium]|nr:hypothetical protein [Caulobacteraceae bacterium]
GNSSRVKRHNFESPLFNFLPSFRDFRTKQLKFAADDLSRQIAIGYDMFIRDSVFQNSQNVFVVNNASATDVRPLIRAPFGMPSTTSEAKPAAWRAETGAKVGSTDGGFLTYKQILATADYARRYLGLMPYEGSSGAAPADNSIFQGKYLLIGGGEIYNALPFDAHILNTKPLAMNLLNDGFKGSIGPNIVFKEEFYDLRFDEDGAFPAPEIEEVLTDTGYSTPNATRQTVLNPAYANATYGVAFLIGASAYEVIDVGPPPAEFTGASISGARFNKLSWNGEVRMTDNVLVNYGSGNLDTNKYGEYLQLIADTTLGIIGNTPRNVIAIIYRRQIAPSLSL